MTSEVAADLVAKARLFHLVIAPTGKAFSNFRQEFTDECETVYSLAEALSDEPPPHGDLVLITDIEKVDVAGIGESNALGPLRERVTQFIRGGASVILLSQYPKMRYPDAPGSSLLHDARDYHPRMRPVAPGDHRLHPLPGWDASQGEATFLTELVAELGTALVARLDQLLFENPLPPSEALSELSASELDALYFAGLIQPAGDRYGWSIPSAIQDLKEAVANSLAATMSPPRDLALAYELLWKIERRVRAALRARAIDEWGGNWKDSLMNPNYFQRVLERARELAYPGVSRVRRLRDPLEWLTLGELLSLRDEKTPLGDLGMSATYWRRLAAEVMPIRNQVSHMRLTKPGDLVKLKQWDAILIGFLNP